MSGFQNLVDNLAPNGVGLSTAISDDWRQGRTMYGGATAGLLLAAAEKTFDDLPPLRSANINFIGPVSDNPVFTGKILRQGKNVTSVQVDGLIDGNCVANGIFIFGTARESVLQKSFPAPPAASPEDCQDFAPEQVRKVLPRFTHNFDMKLIDGHRPGSSADDGYMRLWSRHTDPASRHGMTSLLCIGDIPPPAAAARLKAMGPISSVNWMMNFLAEPETEDGWWHIETNETASGGGYSSQVMRFWNMDGNLVAEGMQAVAIFV